MNNKHIIAGAVALAIGTAFTSCSHDYESDSSAQGVLDNYNRIFIETFGEPADNQTWGFGSAATKELTRSIIDEISDPFTLYDTKDFYKYTVPSNAVAGTDVVGHEEKYVDKPYNIVFTTGSHTIHLWQGERDIYIDGKVTIANNGTNQARFYVLPGAELTLGGGEYINNMEIYVSEGATLNYVWEKLYNQTGGGILFNHGTVNLPSNFEVNQNAIFYNEGTVKGVDITSKPGDGNRSFFYNYGDLTLTGKMELNSCSNFYNEGIVNVKGETYVTQQKIWWINKGHYTTGSMVFSAKNSTFYNYCQLLVLGNAHMYDGEFNLMTNSYTEAATADFDNFIVNMGSNSGFNVKGNNNWVAQGDGTYQGFRTSGSNVYVRLGGTTTIASHRHTLSISSGITYAIKEVKIIKDGEVVTEQYLQSIGDGDYPVEDYNGTAVPFDQLKVTPNTNDCGASWSIDSDNETWGEWARIIVEDLSATSRTDFDFNDAVFDVRINSTGTKAQIKLKAAGGTLPLTIGWSGEEGTSYSEFEVHNMYGVATNVMVNTQAKNGVDGKADVVKTLTGTFNDYYDIKVMVQKLGQWIEITANLGTPASKILVNPTFQWCVERKPISDEYNGSKYSYSFEEYVENPSIGSAWYE